MPLALACGVVGCWRCSFICLTVCLSVVATCRRGADGSEVLHIPLEEEVLQQVLHDMDAMG